LNHHGVAATVDTTFDDPEHPLPRGLRTVIGRRS
jgi:hypothetical protein